MFKKDKVLKVQCVGILVYNIKIIIDIFKRMSRHMMKKSMYCVAKISIGVSMLTS